MNLNEFRKKYPEYNDIPDLELADTFYEKYYSDLDKDNFGGKVFLLHSRRKNRTS